jgi:uncharacterized protein YfaS (alpha-2-macroglobulin family)
MKPLFFKRFIISSLIMILFVLVLPLIAEQTPPAFYLGTDKSFGTDERPYVNLEGNGNYEYSFRVYRVDGIEEFFSKTVKKRLVKEVNDEAYGNAVAIFKETLNSFKTDFRTVARSELNSHTRSETRKIAGIDFEAPYEPGSKALPAFLKNHSLLFSFCVPASKEEWSYRRVPVPLKDNGVYLVEVSSGKSLSYTVVVKSNINFVTKQSDNETLIFAAKRDSGTPVDKAEVKVFTEAGTILGSGTTAKGVYSYSGKTPAKSLIILKKNGEYAISDPDFFARSFYGEGGVRVFIYTDRPVYRPGDTVCFKGAVRNFQGDDYLSVSGSGSVKVITEEGNAVLSGIPVSVSKELGTFDGSFVLPKGSDPYLGTYNVVFDFNGKSYSSEFAVDAYKKPPYLVKVSSPKKTYTGTEKIDVTVSARYYYGSPVANESVRYRVFRKKKFDYSPVGKLPFFADAAEYLGIVNGGSNDLVDQGDGKLDGKGSFEFSFKPAKVDTDYSYNILADVTTADSTISGAASVSVNRSAFFIRAAKELAVYSPGETLQLGVKLLPFDQLLSDADRAKTVGGKSVTATLYSRSFTGISQEGERRLIKEKKEKTASSGDISFSFPLAEKGHYIVVLKSKDANGEETVTETPLWVSGKSDSIEMPFKNITLKTSKDFYDVGEEADVLIMSPVSDGNIFVTLEGNRIISKELVQMKGNSLRYKVKISPAMAPNFTLSVVQFSGNDIYKNQIKVVAPPREKFLSVKVTPAKTEYRPGETAELEIETLDSSRKGISAEVSVAVVDEAIYQIREDQKPSLASFFYHPRINNVSTVFSAAYRFFGYSEEKRLQLALNAKKNFALAALKEEEARSREKFKDTTYWTAKVVTDANGKATVKVPLAENITTWRVTALAMTKDTKVGQGKAQFIAKKYLMMAPGLPSYLVRGKDHTVIANVTNLTDSKINADVKIAAEGGSISGSRSTKVSVDPGKTEHCYFTVTPSADPKVQGCVVEMTVAGGGFTDGTKMTLPLKTYGRDVSLPSTAALLKENDRDSVRITLPQKFSDAKCFIRFSTGTGDALRQSLFYLADYPYGCIEQTMSRFMPLLAAKQAGYLSPKLKENLPRMVSEGMRLIKSHQADDGGFGWYGEQGTDSMMSAYVYRGLVTANRYYPEADKNVISRSRYFLYAALDKGTGTLFEKAYIIFCLSEGEKLQKSMVESLVKGAAREGIYTRTLVALTLFNQGDRDRAVALVKDLLKEYKKDRSAILAGTEKEAWDCDAVEIAASLLTAAVRTGADQEMAETLASDLISMRLDPAWKNSRDTAWAVLALSEKIMKYKEKGGSSGIKISINGKPSGSAALSSSEVDRENTKVWVDAAALKAGVNNIQIEKNGGGAVYATAVVSCSERSDSFLPVDSGFSVERVYHKVEAAATDDGMNLTTEKASSFKAGDLVMVEIYTSRKNGSGNYIMVEDPVPPGFSVVKMDGQYYSDRYAKEYSLKQVYDDRAVFFIKGPAESSVIRYFLRAEIPGKYSTLPSSVSLMYYPDVSGSGSDDVLTVTKKEEK